MKQVCFSQEKSSLFQTVSLDAAKAAIGAAVSATETYVEFVVSSERRVLAMPFSRSIRYFNTLSGFRVQDVRLVFHRNTVKSA